MELIMKRNISFTLKVWFDKHKINFSLLILKIA